jgi:hypothetical protein
MMAYTVACNALLLKHTVAVAASLAAKAYYCCCCQRLLPAQRIISAQSHACAHHSCTLSYNTTHSLVSHTEIPIPSHTPKQQQPNSCINATRACCGCRNLQQLLLQLLQRYFCCCHLLVLLMAGFL